MAILSSRRAFLTGLAGTIIAAPAIVRASSLMGMPRAPFIPPAPLTYPGDLALGDLVGGYSVGLDQITPVGFVTDVDHDLVRVTITSFGHGANNIWMHRATLFKLAAHDRLDAP